MAIKFKLNKRKAVEAVLWFIKAKKINDMYAIWKMLFAAEKYHLNKYGRPITGETYLAMQLGTVPKWLYKEACEQFGIGFVKVGRKLIAERNCIKDFLSDTDIEALKHGYKEYAGMDFDAIKEKNHKEPAWAKHWKRRGKLKEVPIHFEDLIDEDWLREELAWSSSSLVI
ncbi:MAG: Panacea domain-containing protein [Fibromonadales bacterium]|nr:Panacea domain-containing protein [Fibromonadales bacterium]